MWYVRRSRDRFSNEERKDAASTLGYALMTLSKLMSPITPFIAEEIYQGLKKYDKKLLESAHLENWPEYDATSISEKINTDMGKTREIVSMALEERAKVQIPVRQALGKLEITGVDVDEEYLQLIADEVNVKKIILKKGDHAEVKLDTAITPELEKEGYVRELTRRIQALRKDAQLKKEDRVILFIETMYDIKGYEKEIREKVGASSITWGKAPQEGVHTKVKIKDEDFTLAFKKV